MFKNLLVCLGIAAVVTGCSSGGPDSDGAVGLNLTGTWSGTIASTTTGRRASITLQLTQAAEQGEVTGVATFGRTACMSGAGVTGSVAGTGVNLVVESSSSTLTLAGNFTSENDLSGSWFNEAKSSGESSTNGGIQAPASDSATNTEPPSETPSTDEEPEKSLTLASACADESGRWVVSRR